MLIYKLLAFSKTTFRLRYSTQMLVSLTFKIIFITSPVQNVEKTFQLTKADRDLLPKPEFGLQVWCILLNDKVSFRMQWPQFADLQVNDTLVAHKKTRLSSRNLQLVPQYACRVGS